MAISKVSDISGYFNTIYNDTLFVARETNIMASLVMPLSATGWEQRIVPIYPQFSAQVVAEAVDIANPTTLNKTTQATYTPYEIATQALLTDRRMATDPESAANAAAIEMGGAIGTKVDTDLVNLFDNFAVSKGTAGSALTIARTAAALSKLRDNIVMGSKSVVLHPYQWHDLWTELDQPVANQAFLGDVANQALKDYYVGSFLAAAFYVDANIVTDASDDAYGAAFVREALGLDTRVAPSMEVERDSSLRAFEITMTAGYDVQVHRSTYGVGLLSDVTEPTG